MMQLSRRQFLKASAGTVAVAAVADKALALTALQPVVEVDNPLGEYPDRSWERVYHDQYRYDSSFTWCCSPNDTHACRIRAFVRNGVVMRVEQNYDHQTYEDLYGNRGTFAHNPRMCLKGFTFHRRVYGPYRLKGPLMRKGWKQWMDDGSPELTPDVKRKYKFDSRFLDDMVRVSWDTAFTYVAKGLVVIGTRYSGEAGARRLREQGYAPEMIEMMKGAGVRTFKHRAGMPILGMMGKHANTRFNNCILPLLDSWIRKVNPDQAQGGRYWNNYTWHGDQDPSQPWWNGTQNCDVDLADMRFTKLNTSWGKNFVENKMPEAHWKLESIERGARLVVITPEYNPTASRADYWIPVRPETDGTLFLGAAKIILDENYQDIDFIKGFTDMPLLVRTDTLQYLDPFEVVKDYQIPDFSKSYSGRMQGLTQDQIRRLGGMMVWDLAKGKPVPIHREQVGMHLAESGIDPALTGTYRIKLLNGREIDAIPIYQLYQIHLQDYDLDTVHQVNRAPKDLVVRWARDYGTVKPAAIHNGEGVCHYFHMTSMGRAAALVLMLTGNIGKFGTGCHTWSGNYKVGIWQAAPWSGAGASVYLGEDPWNLNLKDDVHGKEIKYRKYYYGEEPGYWNHGDNALIINTPKYGRKVFTGKTHMPSPSKVRWVVNVNILNNAKHHYDMVKNVDPNIEMLVTQDIEMTSDVNHADVAFAVNSWMEFTYPEMTATVSNPWVQIWKGGIRPLYDTRNDLDSFSGVAAKLKEMTGEQRMADTYKFVYHNRVDIYVQRILDASSTFFGYSADVMLKSEKGWMVMCRTYPRHPLWEETNESKPHWTRSGRLETYRVEPEAIEYGENFIVHREGPECTPYLPNAIMTTNPYVRPDDYGIPVTAQHHDDKTVRNIKLPWAEIKQHANPLWEKGYQFYCVTPKTRHRVHSQWSVNDWVQIYESNFGDPYRMDKRTPGVGEHQIHINPQAAKDRGINDGDYCYVDGNPVDRPYRGWKPSDPFYKVARLMIRAKYNPSYPYHVTMAKHAPYVSTAKSVKGHETRPDGRAIAVDTGYQANFRYGAQQSFTRSWLMPMHQTDSLPGKQANALKFKWGFEIDHHAVNTVPKECLIRITKAEDGGIGARGPWEPVRTGFTPGQENEFMTKWLKGEHIKIKV
ncbi:MAG: molybdopterin-dependent oxidoreductase [Nitrospira sp. CR1.1]|nr:molybdopterin-dependent oxidoreductase [Nitrospira sp. CR1.1]